MAPKSTSLGDLCALLSPWWPVESVTGRDGIVISDGKTRVYLIHTDDFCDTIRGDTQGVYCDPKLRDCYLSTPPTRNMTFFMMDYSDVQLAKSVLAVIADSEEMVVDNGFSTVMTGKDLAKRIKSKPHWDWRAGENDRDSSTSSE